MQIRAKRTLRRVVSLALIPSMTGCTAALWTPACQTQAVHPQIAGIVRNYPARGDEALVVTYHAAGDGTDVNLVVPLDADRSPRFPFAPTGRPHAVRLSGSREDVELAGFVDQKQLAALLAKGSSIPGDREELKKHFNGADWSPAAGQISWPYSGVDRQGTACVLAYYTDTTGQIAPTPLDSSKQPDDKIILEPYVHLVLVPASVDRPPGDQTRDKVVAVALTPLSVAGDAAGVGIGIGVAGAAVAVAVPVVVVIAIVNPAALKSTQPAATPAPPPTTTVPVYFRGDESDESTASARLGHRLR